MLWLVVSAAQIDYSIRYDKKAERAIVFEIDLVVLSTLTLIATLELLDKNALAYAAVYRLREDLI